jgi:hypothetical protein
MRFPQRLLPKRTAAKVSWSVYLAVWLGCLLLLYVVWWLPETEVSVDAGRPPWSLADDGFCIVSPPTGHSELPEAPLSMKELQARALAQLPPNYQFLNYEYTIESAVLSTFHRDVTSSQFLHGCRHPVYTFIVYEYGGDLLSVCPGSHRTWPFVWSRVQNLSGPPHTAVLFNCELLHAGQLNECKERVVRQYKICHADDLPKLRHLQGIRTTKRGACVQSPWGATKRKLTYLLSYPLNFWLAPWLMRKEPEGTWMGWVQGLLDEQFYNNV